MFFTHKKIKQTIEEKHTLVNIKMEAGGGLSMLVHYVKQRKNSLNISRQMPQSLM